MQNLQDYYKKLEEFIADITVFTKEKVNNETKALYLANRDSFNPEIIPLLSYTLASYPETHEKIDQMYEVAKAKIADEDADKIEVDGLNRNLPPKAQIQYHKMLRVCLSEYEQTRKQCLKLLKQIAPKQYMGNDNEAKIIEKLSAGAFNTKYIVLIYLSLYLSNFQISVLKKQSVYALQIFLASTKQSLMLPGWHELPEETETKEKVKFDAFMQNVLTSIDMQYIALNYYNEQTPEDRLIREASTNQNLIREYMNNAYDDYLNVEQMTTPIVSLKNTEKAAKMYLDVEKRLKNWEEQKSEFKKKDRKKLKRDPELQEFVRSVLKRNARVEAGFLGNLIETLSLPYNEILDAELSEQDLTAINAAHEGLVDVVTDEVVPLSNDLWKNMPPNRMMAASLICILKKRIEKSETELKQALVLLEEARKMNAGRETEEEKTEDLFVGEAELTEADSAAYIASLEEENRKLRMKNRELVDRMNEEEREWKEEKEKFKEENARLRAENKEQKEMIDDLLMTQEEETEDEESLTVGVDQMKEEIEHAGVLFVSGHPTWRTAMKKEFPQMRFVEPREYQITPAIFRDINFVVYHLQHGNHSMYYKCLECKNKNTRILFVNQNNTKLCIKRIYDYIEKNKNQKVSNEEIG